MADDLAPEPPPKVEVDEEPKEPKDEEPKLRERSLGRSKQMVSELALGTWGLSGDAYGPVYHKEVDRVIDRAIQLGVTLYDTADVYGDGKMEEKLGEKLDPKKHRVVTKIGTFKSDDPPRKKFDPKSLAEAMDKSRERLKRDKLDIVLLHNPTVEALEGECVAFMRDSVKDGKLALWGVSCGSAEVAEKAVDKSCDIIEIAYNLFHQKPLHSIADKVASTETGVLARSALSHGLLAGHWPKTKVFFDNDHRSKRWTKDQVKFRIEQLAAVRQLVGDDILTMRSAAVRFVLENQLVTSVVLGPRSVTQLNQLIHEAGKGPPYIEQKALEELPARLEAVGITL